MYYTEIKYSIVPWQQSRRRWASLQNKKNAVLEYDDTETTEYNFDGFQEDDYRRVRVTKKDFSLYELFRKYKKGKLVLSPGFQRKDVWSSRQKIELIESILMGLPLPIFYFKQSEQAIYITVDGRQRLSAIFQYMEDKYSLSNLKIMRHLEGCKFSNLTGEMGIYQSQLEDYQIYAHVILPPTPDKILFDIFDRVNRGGTKLNKQEIRNALYSGPALRMIEEITHNKIFIEATKLRPKKDKRMKGSYLLNRFFAFLLLREEKLFFDNKLYIYRGDIDDLLAKTLQQLNHDERDYKKLIKMVLSCLEKSTIVFGEGAFRINGNPSKSLNMNMFETAMYLLYKLKDCNIKQTQEVRDLYYVTCESTENIKYFERGRNAQDYVRKRFDLMDEIVQLMMESNYDKKSSYRVI